MEDIRIGTQMDFRISDVGYISVVRNKDFTISYKNGKTIMSFLYIKKGEMKYIFEDKTIVCKEEQVIFIPQGVPYQAIYLKDDTTMKMITFGIAEKNIPEFLSKPMLIDMDKIVSVFKSSSLSDTRNPLFLASKAYELVYLIQTRATKIPSKYSKIAPAIEEITKKYYENMPISYYADMCSMGESNFRRLFKEYTDKSPIDYRNTIRIYEARKLIESGECTVQEAAYIVGFNNMSFYYDVVKKLTK